MNISNKTIQNTMRLLGSIVLVLAVALVAFLAWITGTVGIDLFLLMAFGVGLITMVGGVAMIYFSYGMIVEEKEETRPEFIYTRDAFMLARKCS